jgi:hypothetical protein
MDFIALFSRLLFMVRRPHYLVTPIMLAAGWITLIILPILGEKVLQNPEKGSFYGLSGAWCWIGVRYGVARLLYLYASSFNCYSLHLNNDFLLFRSGFF